MNGPDINAAVAEIYPPYFLFSEELNAILYIHRLLRNWLDKHDENMEQYSSRPVTTALATELYFESEEREAAETLARSLVSKKV